MSALSLAHHAQRSNVLKCYFRVIAITKGVVAAYLCLGLFTLLLAVSCSFERTPLLDYGAAGSSGADTSQGDSLHDPVSSNNENEDGESSENPDFAATDGSASNNQEEGGRTVRDSSIRDTSLNDSRIMSDASDTSVIPPPPVDGESQIDCPVTGVFGGRITVDTYWGGRSLPGLELVAMVDPGRAPIVLHILYTIDTVESDGTIHATAKTCNIELPPFYSSLVCESYLPEFPLQAWDSSANPTFDITGRVSCTNPGCAIHTDTIPAQVGIELNDPSGTWPTASETESVLCSQGTGIACFPDHDGDGYEGVTAVLRTEGDARTDCKTPTAAYSYRAAPLSTDWRIISEDPVPRTDRIHLGTRAMVGGDPIIGNDCNARGLAVAEGFESRAISCFLQPGMPTGNGDVAGENTPCRSDQREFIDSNLPLYRCMKAGDVPNPDLTSIEDQSPSNGPQISLIRLGDLGANITCDDVRNAPY
jgi:hypothetical protein